MYPLAETLSYGPYELKAYIPNFPKHRWESQKSLKLWVLHPSKVRWSRFVSLKNAVFSELFWRKSFFDPLQPSIPPPMIYINGKLCMSAFRTYPNNRIFLNQQAIRILLTVGDRNVPMYWDLVVIKVRSVDKNCLHMEICQPNKNCLFWSHLVKNVTKLRQSTILSCSLTLGDKWSRNRLEVSGQKRPALKASQATLIYFSWSHLVKNMTKCRKAMIPWWISETDWKMVMQQKCSQLTKIAPL